MAQFDLWLKRLLSEVYTLEEIYRVLSEFNGSRPSEVTMASRCATRLVRFAPGTAMHLNRFMRVLYNHGSI
jgi:hypothetical protein